VQFDLLSWGIGIPTGVGVNWLSIWLYQRCQKRKRAKGDYFTTNYSDGTFDFEGRVKTHISAEEVLENLLESLKREPEAEDQPTSNPPPDNDAD
jgi:hypothetical protein